MMRAVFIAVAGIVLAGTLNGQSSPIFERLTGGVRSHTVRSGETLTSIGARYGVDWRTVARENALRSPDTLRAGQILRIDNRHIVPIPSFETGIVINIPQRMLFYFVDRELVRYYPVGLGRVDWPTPTGAFHVAGRDENPTWIVPLSIQQEMRSEGKPVIQQMPPGPSNPLGAFRLRLSDPGYSIHGTNAPSSIYGFPSHGCIRLHPEDIADLFPLVAAGTPVEIVYEPVLMAVLPDGQVFLEVHRDIYGVSGDAQEAADRLIEDLGLESVHQETVVRTIREAAGIARPVPAVASRPMATPADPVVLMGHAVSAGPALRCGTWENP